MSNCTANIPRGHQFAMTEMGVAKPYTTRLAFNNFSMRKAVERVQDDGITEDLWERSGDEVIVAERITGSASLNPRADNLQTLCLPIFGGSAFALNVKLPGTICNYFQLGHYDPYNARILDYADLVVAQATFAAQQGGLLNLSMNLEGKTASVDATVANWPALSLSTQQPFAMRQGTLTIGGTAKLFKRFQFTVDNGILADEFFNSLTRGDMPSVMQTFTLTHDSPWETATEIDNLGTIREVAATLEFLSGTKRLYLEFPRLFGVDEEPGISGRERILKGFTWKAKYVPGNAIDAPVRITIVGS